MAMLFALTFAFSGAAQSKDKALAEDVVRTYFTATDHLYLVPQIEGVGHFVHARSTPSQGCAKAWRGLSLWTVGIGAGRPWRVAVVAGRPFLLSEPTAWEAFVDALLRTGRTDGLEPTIGCLTETLATSIAVQPSDEVLLTDSLSTPGRSQASGELIGALSEGWPAPVIYELGTDSVAVFTLFRVAPSHLSANVNLVQPVAYALVFDAQGRLVTWTSRDGGTIAVPTTPPMDTAFDED